MESLNLIAHLEGKLKAAVNLNQRTASSWVLSLKLMYDGGPAGQLSFKLEGYTAKEARQIAWSIPSNAFLMREIDEYLWGESD